MAIEIRLDDLRGDAITALLRAHLDHMREVTPVCSVHALAVEDLRASDITFWSAWEQGELVGCGALRELDARSGEIKSMRTVDAHRGKGVASRVLEHLLEEARRRGYSRVSLETGSMEAFEPARALYARYGFVPCGPYADYTDDPNSAFMTKALTDDLGS